MNQSPSHIPHTDLLCNGIGMRRSSLELREHDPLWSRAFTVERVRIFSACGSCPVQLEHIGSTSIPALAAKPILDLGLLVDACNLDAVAAALRTLDYDYRGQYDARPGRFYAVLDHGYVRLCQLHIYTDPDAGWSQQILFRNVLRTNEALREEYATAKQRIQHQARSDKHLYAQVKTEWMDVFYHKVVGELRSPFPSVLPCVVAEEGKWAALNPRSSKS